MNFDEAKIQELFREFWRKNKNNMKYYYKGKCVEPENISGFSIQLTEGDYGDGFNFSCESINLRVQLDSHDRLCKAHFYIKVLPVQNQNDDMPTEVITEIKDNKIYLSD